MLTEEEVYNGSKRWLRKNGYTVLAGQPARGVDHLPVIEIKQPSGDKGSRDAYKPDLVAYKNGIFYIVECKPGFDHGDLIKINDVLGSEDRLTNFYHELEQYQLLLKVGYRYSIETFMHSVEGVLAFSGDEGPTCNLHKLIVCTWQGTATFIE
jgi:hypothetical protein